MAHMHASLAHVYVWAPMCRGACVHTPWWMGSSEYACGLGPACLRSSSCRPFLPFHFRLLFLRFGKLPWLHAGRSRLGMVKKLDSGFARPPVQSGVPAISVSNWHFGERFKC
uniref:Putative secreted protein n=1 Tax=Ixodes ricinus TaxID=34613 RepID=A0A6B0UJZ8_IXORI